MKRLLFPSSSESFASLQLQVQDLTGVKIADQQISTAPAGANAVKPAPNASIVSLGLKHGDILYLKSNAPAGPSSATPAASVAAAATPQPALTKYCQHGPSGRCLHCNPAPIGDKTRIPCNHGPNATCPNCSAFVQQGKADPKNEQLAPWLCSHPTSAFCPKCIPKSDDDDTKVAAGGATRCDCNKAKGQQCVVCVAKPVALKVNFVPYAYFMEEKKALCRFAHPPSQTCASCAPPKLEVYTGKKNCDRGHKPWPYGVCLSCAPPNAHLRLQKYRHCDGVTFEDLRCLQGFYRRWLSKGAENQRAAILFGTYMDEPEATQLRGAVRAQVQAMYEPPQEALSGKKGVRFLKDPNEASVVAVAGWLGLQPVGWIIATLPRSGAKYGGDVLLSGPEIKQAARFQDRYKDDQGHSRFVTVVVEQAEHVEPKSYQVSDQCVALERDGVLALSADPFMLASRTPQAGELVPTVVYKDRPLKPGQEFLPDELVVKVIVMQPGKPMQKFKYSEFAAVGSEQELRQYLQRHKNEEYHDKLSDFNVLCYLPTVLGAGNNLAQRVISAVGAGVKLPAELKVELDRAFSAKKLI